MSKLTMHLQRIPDWWTEFVDRCQGRLEYVVGVDTFPKHVDLKVLGRTYLPDSESGALVDAGGIGADAWIDRFAPVYRDNPHVERWIGPNEYVLWSQEHVDRFNAFHVRFIERMSSLGHGVMCGQINTGWPHLRKYPEDPPPYPETLASTLGALRAHGGWFSLHEYGPRDMRDAVGNVLRYRDTRAELIAAGVVNLPDFYISETGVDEETVDPASDYGHWGWRKYNDWPGYFAQLQWYSGELDKDPYVKGASIFTEGGGWESFELDREQALELADFIAQDAPPPPPERAESLYLSKYQEGTSRAVLQRLWDNGQRAIGFRVTGPNTPDNPTHTEIDRVFAEFYPIAREIGFLCYGFHYLHPALDNQARDFGRAVAGKTFELGLYGDVEHGGLDGDRCARFFEAADRETGRVVDVYGRKSQLDAWRESDKGRWQEGRRLWLAAWTYDLAKLPALPETWKDDGFEWWQWTNMAYLPGVEPPDRVCLDAWRGTTDELLEEYGNGEEEETDMDVKVFDVTGAERDWDWLIETYGAVNIQKPDATSYFKVTEIREKHDDTAFVVKVLNADGSPKVNKTVIFYWDTAPDALGSGWLEQGVGGTTNENGDVGFGMGSGAWYTPPEQGPHKSWLFGENVSEMAEGIGMRIGPDGPTNHDHFDITFQYVEGDDPEPEPEGDLAEVVEQLTRIADSLESIEERWPFA